MRRLCLTLLGVLWLASPASAQTLDYQNATSTAGSATPTVTIVGGTDAGDLLVIAIAIRVSATITGVADGTNGAWICPVGADVSDGNTRAAICYFQNSAASGSDVVVTVTLNAAQTTYLNVTEWSGMATASALDQVNESTDTGTPYTHGSITTTQAGIIITSSAQNGTTTETPNASFTALTNTGGRDYFQYWITSGAQTTTGEYTAVETTQLTSGAIASFKAAVAAAATPRLMLLGVGGVE